MKKERELKHDGPSGWDSFCKLVREKALSFVRPGRKNRPMCASLSQNTYKRFLRNKTAVLGAVILLFLVFLIIFANVLIPVEKVTAYDVTNRLTPPCAEHWFGTDNLGRDVLARIVYGTRISVGIGVGSTLLSLSLGAILAAVCSLSRRLDFIIMRVMDVWSSIPTILLALVFLAVLGGSVANMMLTLSVVSVPTFTLYIRSVVLSVAERDYVSAAYLSGSKSARLVWRHILPNAIDTIIVDATMTVSNMMLAAASLSAIGMGVAPPSPEWGAMLSYATDYIKTSPYLFIFPGCAVVLAAIAINLVGDGLRDALDPGSMR